MHGYGEFYWKDGKKYFGFYLNDKKEGFGIYFWEKTKKFFVGFWKNGKQEGVGKKMAAGQVKYSYWKNGKIFKDYDGLEMALNEMTKQQLVYSKFLFYDIDDMLEYFK